MEEPERLSYEKLVEITDNFSRMIGQGGFGKVYKGTYKDEAMAVKVLHDHVAFKSNLSFEQELCNIWNLRHHNIVRLIACCDETHGERQQFEGKDFWVQVTHRALCFEYMPNGSLEKYLSAEQCVDLDWHRAYKIIKGTCEGIKYLQERNMYHLDLKPENILLDNNMVAKLADFGLSKIVDDTRTIITETTMGTPGYMPPEYVGGAKKVSPKFDIFSLGVVIIEMVAGRETYYDCKTTSSEKIIEQAEAKWRSKLQETCSDSLLEEYCKQVKLCTEIALNCVEDDRKERPTIVDIINKMNETEIAVDKASLTSKSTRGEGSSTVSQPAQSRLVPSPDVQADTKPDKTGITKIGPWGGNGGNPRDINVAPHRLESLTICIVGDVIGSLSFSYYDRDGQQHTGGPWGGCSEIEHKIHLEPTEFLVGISGTSAIYGPYHNIITSLTFTTNTRSFGPYGQVRGEHFDIPVHGDGYIVGFFGRAQLHLDAIGVYVNMREAEDGLAKFGPWGGDGGRPQDIEVSSTHLESVTIYSGAVIDSLAFSYRDKNRQCHTAGPWGGDGGDDNMIWLGHSEFLTGVVGTIGRPLEQSNHITSLVLVTNARSYGPFGEVRGTCFHIPVRGNGRIVGFFGRADQYVNAIGVYTNHNKLETLQQAVVETDIQHRIASRIGPWGGNGGVPRDITVPSNRLESMTIFSGRIVDSFEFSYRDHNGHRHTAGPWGGSRANDHHKIELGPSENVVHVSGTIGPHGGLIVVTSLTFVTNTGTYGPFGHGKGTAFDVPVQSNRKVVGFFVRSGVFIDAIGFHTAPL